MFISHNRITHLLSGEERHVELSEPFFLLPHSIKLHSEKFPTRTNILSISLGWCHLFFGPLFFFPLCLIFLFTALAQSQEKSIFRATLDFTNNTPVGPVFPPQHCSQTVLLQRSSDSHGSDLPGTLSAQRGCIWSQAPEDWSSASSSVVFLYLFWVNSEHTCECAHVVGCIQCLQQREQRHADGLSTVNTS